MININISYYILYQIAVITSILMIASIAIAGVVLLMMKDKKEQEIYVYEEKWL